MSPASVALLERADLTAVASLHRRAFPDYRSTKLGAGYCRRMLGAYAAHPEAWVAVARVDRRSPPIGYLVAAPPEVQRALNRSLRPWAALALVTAPWRLVGGRRAAVAPTPGAPASDDAGPTRPTGPTGPTRASGPSAPATIRVVLIGTDPTARCHGVGAALLADFARRAAGEGHAVADLTVAAANGAARRAYARAGWTEVALEGAVAVRCRLELGPAS